MGIERPIITLIIVAKNIFQNLKTGEDYTGAGH